MKIITLLAGVLALLCIALSGPLYKMEVLDLMGMLSAVRLAAMIGLLTLVLALIQVLFMRKKISWKATGISVAMAVVAMSFPIGMMMKARSVPPIHDITTDMVNPPQFDAILPLRADAMNPAEYQGEEIAKQQMAAYPELLTKTYQQPADKVFDAALSAITDMGLEVVASDKINGVIEASHTTAWFGFVDDVVVRIHGNAPATLLDVRSKSRVGISDLGKNAERIGEILVGVEANLN